MDLNKKLIDNCKTGNLAVVKFLLANGADVHYDEDDAVAWAAYEGNLDLVKYLVKQGANTHEQGEGALRWAAVHGHLETVKYLVECCGADVHARDDWAIRNASNRHHADVVAFLRGTPVAPKELTIDEISRLLGYPVKVVAKPAWRKKLKTPEKPYETDRHKPDLGC